MPKTRLPATAARAVWQQVTKGRAGMRWDSVVDKVWKDIGGNQEEILLSIREVWGGYKTEVREVKATRSSKKQGQGGGTLLDICGGFKSRNQDEGVFARPNGLRHFV